MKTMLVLFIAFATGSVFADHPCLLLAAPEKKKIFSELATATFELKAQMSSRQLTPNDLKTESQKLAFLGIVLEKSGVPPEPLLNAAENEKHSQTINRIVSNLDFSNGIRRRIFIGAVQRILVVNHLLTAEKYFRLLKPKRVLREMISEKQKAENALSKGIDILDENALLHSLDRMERITSSRSYRFISSLAASTTLAIFTFHHLGILRGMPGIQLLHSIPSPTRDNAADESLLNYFWKYALVDLSISTAQRMFSMYLTYSAIMFVGNALQPALDLVRPLIINDERLDDVQKSNFSIERIRKIQFEAWRQSFNNIEKRWPDPNNAEDKIEMDLVWNDLMARTEEELMVSYSKTP